MNPEWFKKIDYYKSNNISMALAIDELFALVRNHEWFYDIDSENNVIVVYVHFMNRNVFTLVPDIIYGHRVVLRYASYLLCQDKYG